MIFRAWRYAYGGAKIMVLKSLLLTAEDYHFLLRSRQLDYFLGYLATTAYGAALRGWNWHIPEAETELSRRLYGELVQAFIKVGRGLKKREQLFIGVLAQRLVAENLKVVLRSLHRGLAQEQAVRLLIPVDQLSPLNFTDLLKTRDIDSLVYYLDPTPWGPPLARGLPRYRREHNLFPLEMSLDLWVSAYILQGREHLSSRDRRLSGQLLGVMADITNLIWVGRFREIYGFPGGEIYQYLLEAGSLGEPRRRHDLAFAPNLETMISGLPRRPYGELLAGVTDLAGLEERLAGYWVKTLEKILRLPPFQVGLPMTYLFLKELEIRNLITLVTGLILHIPPDRLAPLIQARAAGGGYV
jgi:V/A-type H+-transporting ATPase subunit C